VSLTIYNVKGELVRTLVTGERQAGAHVEVWDGYDDTGARTSSGLYIYNLEADGLSQSKKMIKLK
jgi:flagellar hook assembly protein FlgD